MPFLLRRRIIFVVFFALKLLKIIEVIYIIFLYISHIFFSMLMNSLIIKQQLLGTKTQA